MLCRDNFHYRYRGKCLPMEKLVKTESWTPNAIDRTAAGSQTLTAYRTVHGIVYARGKVGGKKVAFVRQRSTYFHEADSVIGFAQLNEPGFVDRPRGSRRRSKIDFTFNWAYLDSEQIAYALSGGIPQRPRGPRRTSRSSAPASSTGRGSSPRTQSADYLPFAKHPQAVDPPYLVSWNNKQAPGWAAADDKYAYGPLQRSQMISDRVRAATKGAKKMTIVQLVQAMEEPATTGPARLPPAADAVQGDRQAEGGPTCERRWRRCSAWHKAGAHRRDLDRDGVDEETPAIQLMDAWWPKLVTAQFKPALGNRAFEALEVMISTGDHTGGSPDAPDFYDGWWGYVSKDLRAISGRSRRAPSAAGTAAAATNRSAARCCSGPCGRRSRSRRPSSTGAATANAPPSRSRPASTRTGRR